MGCGGSSAGTEPNDGPPDLADGSSDCAGCRILLKGIVQPYAPYVVGSHVYLEDWGAGKLLRVPLAGGAPLADDAYDSVFRVSLADPEPKATAYARFEHAMRPLEWQASLTWSVGRWRGRPLHAGERRHSHASS